MNFRHNIALKFLLILSICSITLFVDAQEEASISDIQGLGNSSPFNNQMVWTRANVVTAVGSNFFFIQSKESNEDSNPLSSEGLMVMSSNNLPKVNDIIDVRGEIDERNGNTLMFLEEIIYLNDGPSPIASFKLDDDFPSGIPNSIDDLERLENTLVRFEDAWVCSPSDDQGLVYVSTKSLRPRREAGVLYPAPNGFIEWDGNPELMEVVFHAFGGSRELEVLGNSKLSGYGILLQNDNEYQIWPIDYELFAPSMQEIPSIKENEISVGCLNALRFFTNDVNYENRLKKLARYVVEKMKSPDIIGFQEIGGEKEMQDLIEEIRNLDSSAEYKLWILDASGDINNCYLTRNTISNVEISQLGLFETLSIGGRKHDRPPLLLTATINTAAQQDISILNLHQRSLNGIEGSNSEFVRIKRHEQAISVAQMVKSLQNQNRNIIVLGDFNAFEFSDGYVDVVNQIRGTESLGAEYEIVPVLTEPLANVSIEYSPTEEQYSYVFNGSIQILDHCLVGALSDMIVSDFTYVRGNADAPDKFLGVDNDLRISDHDGFVLYLDVGQNPNEIDQVPQVDQINIWYPNPFKAANKINLVLPQKDNVELGVYTLGGKLLFAKTLIAFESGELALENLDFFAEGMYILKVKTRNFEHLGKLVYFKE